MSVGRHLLLAEEGKPTVKHKRVFRIMNIGAVHAPHAVELLSDNGSRFTARETLDFAAALGLVPCFTPVQSRERYCRSLRQNVRARLCSLPSIAGAATVLRQTAKWFNYYHESHPYLGLGIISEIAPELTRHGLPLSNREA